MPRQRRRIEPGTTYHLISRFVDREWFIRSDVERTRYLKLLAVALEGSDWKLLAYAIMSNHIHLATVAGEQRLDAWIRCVHAPFAESMNRAYDRIGPMFVRGPKAFAVEPEGVGYLLAYIHNNPVRAGLCTTAVASAWTSHRAYLGKAAVPAWLHVAEGLARAGFADRATFDAWVNDPARAENEASFDEEQRRCEAQVARASTRSTHVARTLDTAATIVAATADRLGVPLDEVRSTSRSDRVVLARWVAVRSALALGVSGHAVAAALRLSPQRVSQLRRQPISDQLRRLSCEVSGQIECATRSSGV